MIKQVLAGVAAIGTVSGVALAQTYIYMSPPAAAFAVGRPGFSRRALYPAGGRRRA